VKKVTRRRKLRGEESFQEKKALRRRKLSGEEGFQGEKRSEEDSFSKRGAPKRSYAKATLGPQRA